MMKAKAGLPTPQSPQSPQVPQRHKAQAHIARGGPMGPVCLRLRPATMASRHLQTLKNYNAQAATLQIGEEEQIRPARLCRCLWLASIPKLSTGAPLKQS